MRRDEVKSLVQAHGPEAFTNKLIEMLGEKKIKAEDVSMLGLFEALVGPVDEHLGQARQRGNKIAFMTGSFRKEEVSSSAFPIATGALIASKVIEGYSLVEKIGDDLVTIYPSKRKTETFSGFTAVDGPLPVDEGREYEDSDIGEKFVTVGPAIKRGRLLGITEEMVVHDQTGQLLMRAQALGEKLALDREIRILTAISGNNAQTYKPQNVATNIFSAGNANLVLANGLVDWTNIDTMLQQAAKQTDDKASKIVVPMKDLVVPRALLGTALHVTRSTMVRTQDTIAGLPNATYGAAPFVGMFTPRSSPLLDGLGGTGASDWFMGDFKKAFVYQEVWPIQTLAAREGHEAEFRRDILFLYKVREYGEVGCLDYRWVYKAQK